jgi:hypothetical protein
MIVVFAFPQTTEINEEIECALGFLAMTLKMSVD